MARERVLDSVESILFTIAGGADGLVTISTTHGFKVKASVIISATSIPNLTLEVKAVLSETTLVVGLSGNINNRYNLSSYTTFLNSAIAQPSQDRPKIPKDDQDRFTYESEPTLARRVINVDELGNLITDTNPLPVSVTGGINVGTVDVNLSHIDSLSNHPPDSVRVGDGINELKVNGDGSVNSIVLNKLADKIHDEVEIMTKTLDGDPEVIVFRNANVDVFTLTLSYDSDGDLQKVKRT